jgi:hypothetical protein
LACRHGAIVGRTARRCLLPARKELKKAADLYQNRSVVASRTHQAGWLECHNDAAENCLHGAEFGHFCSLYKFAFVAESTGLYFKLFMKNNRI